MKTIEEKIAALVARIEREVKKSAGKGLAKAMPFIEARVKEAASVKAPTRLVKPRDGGKPYLVATTNAVKGRPLRIVSGRFWDSITSYMENETTGVFGSNARADVEESSEAFERIFGLKAEAGFLYPAFHEIEGDDEGSGQHKTFQPTIKKYLKEIGIIVGSEVKVALETK